MPLQLFISCSIALFPFNTPPTAVQQTDEHHEMIITADGLVAMDAPEGWQQANGPGLAFFLRKKDSAENAPVFMYLSATPYGPTEESKTSEEVISTDISDFKQRFKTGNVQKSSDIDLPRVKSRATIYTFISGQSHNSFEKIAYIAELHRVLIVCMSAKNEAAFKESDAAFISFVKSFGGSITETATPTSQ